MSASIRMCEGIARRALEGLPWKARFVKKEVVPEGKVPQPWVAKTILSSDARVFVHASSPELMREIVTAIDSRLEYLREEKSDDAA